MRITRYRPSPPSGGSTDFLKREWPVKLDNWTTTADLNPIYADLRAHDLETCVAEHEAFGFTVVPPEKVAPPEFHARLRQGLLDVHQRRGGRRIDPQDINTARLDDPSVARKPLDAHWQLLGEDRVFEEALMNPVVLAMARYILGKNVILSDMLGLLKQEDETPTHLLHTDQHGTPPPLPQYAQVLNITWTLTDYTRDNGSVAIVPGSHRFGRMPAPYERDFLKNDAPVPAIPVECPAGSLIIWGGTTWHGAFPRRAPGIRANLIMVFNRSYLKQIRDFGATTPQEVIDRNPPEFGRLLGLESPYPFDIKGPDPKKVPALIEAGRTPWS
jgi:hypothetical protein